MELINIGVALNYAKYVFCNLRKGYWIYFSLENPQSHSTYTEETERSMSVGQGEDKGKDQIVEGLLDLESEFSTLSQV